ncbi:hypothetical protein QFC21_002153 [Naganishia friedmannii]|uniref:Uncharacterized protein n=1 Tax=Naganishia friedmannii TaxID=89922 RepID=A0ACC2W0J2_9TREE|nr:hypothetical protein QFC21_002153 [Naganishia friedmannii]
MSFLALPTEVLEIIVNYLNPGPSGSQYYRAFALTACLCNVDEIRAREQRTYPMSLESKRGISALASTSKGLRMAIFDRVFSKKVTMDWNKATPQQSRISLDVMARAKVQTLILKGSSIDHPCTRPLLVDYANLSPQLREIEIMLKRVTPQQAINMRNQSTTSPCVSVSDTTARGSSSQSVNLAVYSEIYFRGRTDEGFTKKLLKDFATAGHLRQLNLPRLDSYHLELTFSKSRDSRSEPTFWTYFTRRMENACQIPANNVSMCFLFQLDGEPERFLAALSTAIRQWPKEVECISFRLDLDEFVLGGHRRILDVIKTGKDGQPKLGDGSLPSKKDLDRFTEKMRKTRTNLCSYVLTGTSSIIRIDQSELQYFQKYYAEMQSIYSDDGDEETDGSDSQLEEYKEDMEMEFEAQEEQAAERYGYK